MHAMLRSSTRFLDRPLSLASRGVVLLGIVALVAGAFLPLWRIQLVAPQYQEGLSLQMYTPQDHRWKRWTGPVRDQHAQPLHRHEGHRAERLRGDDLDAVRHRDLRPALTAVRDHGTHRPSRRSRRLVHLFRRLFAGNVRVSIVELRPSPEPRGSDARRAVHSVVIGRQQIANFVQTSIPMSGTACMGLFLVSILFAIWMSRQEEM